MRTSDELLAAYSAYYSRNAIWKDVRPGCCCRNPVASHEGEEAAEIAAMHRPRALGGGHLDGKVRFQPGDEGVAAVCDIEAHRQAGLPPPESGSPPVYPSKFFREAIW